MNAIDATVPSPILVEPCSPLRWAGGKAQHEAHADKLPSPIGATGYREPFIGGGALFFRLYCGIRPAVLSDLNPHLIALYAAIRDKPEELIEALGKHAYSADHYYAIRDRFNEAPYAPLVTRAAWFLYLNKAGFNGLCRYNRTGEFNVPFGRTGNGEPPTICDAANIRACSAALQGVELRCLDFERALADVRPGEVVFLDPPYVAASKTKDFTGYTAEGFTALDQKRLASMLTRLDEEGANWALTNADTPESHALYEGWDIVTVGIQRSICGKGKKGADGTTGATREKAAEIIVRNRPSSRA